MQQPLTDRARFIAGDWGTTNLRLALCRADGTVVAERDGSGVQALNGALEGCFQQLVADWDRQYGALPAILCGMAGSNLGWRDVSYLAAPTKLAEIADAALRFEALGRTVSILPGISCTNALAAPDLMRGEETQIAGAAMLDTGLMVGRHLLCLPGTHTKWVVLQNGIIRQFLTAISGELFDILNRHSILAGRRDKPQSGVSPALLSGLAQARQHPRADLMHLLFQTRSRQITDELPRADAGAFLSGLVVGQDVSGALRILGEVAAEMPCVTVIGTAALTDIYVAALDSHAIKARAVDGRAASLAGLAAAYRQLGS